MYNPPKAIFIAFKSKEKSMKRLVLSTLALMSYTMLSAAPFAYVADFEGNQVGIFDVATNTATGYVTTTPFTIANPVYVAFAPSGTKAYLLTVTPYAGYVIDVTTNTVTSQIDSSSFPFNAPHLAIAFTPDGTKAYVTNEELKPSHHHRCFHGHDHRVCQY